MDELVRRRLAELESQIRARLRRVTSHFDEDQFTVLVRRIALNALRGEIGRDYYSRLVGEIDPQRGPQS